MSSVHEFNTCLASGRDGEGGNRIKRVFRRSVAWGPSLCSESLKSTPTHGAVLCTVDFRVAHLLFVFYIVITHVCVISHFMIPYFLFGRLCINLSCIHYITKLYLHTFCCHNTQLCKYNFFLFWKGSFHVFLPSGLWLHVHCLE